MSSLEVGSFHSCRIRLLSPPELLGGVWELYGKLPNLHRIPLEPSKTQGFQEQLRATKSYQEPLRALKALLRGCVVEGPYLGSSDTCKLLTGKGP